MAFLNTETGLTEFAPLNLVEKQSGVGGIFSKFFKFTQDDNVDNELTKNEPEYSNFSPNTSVDIKFSPSKSDSNDLVKTKQSPTFSIQYNEHGISKNPFTEVRTLPYVLRRVSNILSIKKDSNESDLKQYWMPDSVSKECYDCGEKFTTFRRRHHCRICGQIFCAQCCNREVPGKIIRQQGSLRVCTYCCKVVLSYLNDNELSVDLKAVQDDLMMKFGETNFYKENNEEGNTNYSNDTLENKRKVSFVYQEENLVGSKYFDSYLLVDPNPIKSRYAYMNNLIFEMFRGEHPITVDGYVINNVKYDTCFTGTRLVDWLIEQKKTLSRTHSLAIGQNLLDAKYILAVEHCDIGFVDGPALYRYCLDTLDFSGADCLLEETTIQNSGVTGKTRVSNSDYQLDIDIMKNTAHISRNHSLKSSTSKEKKKISSSLFNSDFTDDVIQEFMSKYLKYKDINPTLWAVVDESILSEENGELKTFSSLKNIFDQHLHNAVNQLLALEGLSLTWSQVILPLAEKVLTEIRIDFEKKDIFDIGYFVKVRKLACGERKDSYLLSGIVCNKNIAHREMCSKLIEPRILLLECPIVYQRVEDKLTSLEPVLMQEQEYLKQVVSRIAALKPDLILVHRSVSHLAQELLLYHGITLVLNVKMSVMERIARCINANIITTIDAHIGTTQLGSCRSFYIKKYVLADGMVKNMMFFEGCAFPQLGCTILLHGASENELSKVKRVMEATVFMKYNAKLEKSFLLDTFAKPPASPTFTFISDPYCKRKTMYQEEDEVLSVEMTNNTKGKHDSGVIKSDKLDADDRKVSTKLIVETDDPLNMRSRVDEDVLFEETKKEELTALEVTEVPIIDNQFKMALQDTVLCYSPFVDINLPYLETSVGRRCELRKFFPKEVYNSGSRRSENETPQSIRTFTFNSEPAKSTNQNAEVKLHPFVTTKFKESADSDTVQALLASYRASGAHYGRNVKTETPNTVLGKIPLTITTSKSVSQSTNFLDPRNHQRLSVLFSSYLDFTQNSPEYCVNPRIMNMSFYGCNDIPLGSFLEKYCFRNSYICACDLPMLDHTRRYVHDSGCIQVNLKKLDSLPMENNNILVWSACTVCKLLTPFMPMSRDARNLSFAKYLELRFHSGKYTCRADVAKSCNHSLHHDYCQYFYHNNIVAIFKYSDILPWEVSLPKSIIEISPSKIQRNVIMDELKKWSLMGHELFSAILEKLCSNIIDPNIVGSLKKRLNKEQSEFKQGVDEIQILLVNEEESITSVSTCEVHQLEDKINGMKQKVAKVLLDWNLALVKLESMKKDEKNKSKSLSEESQHENDGAFDSAQLDKSCSTEDTVSVNVQTLFNKIDLERRLSDKSDRNSISSISSSDLLTEITQSQVTDKITMKALILQVLPNSFQNQQPLLNNPINSDEHHLLNQCGAFPLCVYENEPSSIIAYSLNSPVYDNFVNSVVKNVANRGESLSRNQSRNDLEYVTPDSVTEASLKEPLSEIDELKKTEMFEEKNRIISNKSSEQQHVEVNFSDSTANFTVKIYYAKQFRELRNVILPSGDESFIRSLSRCISWAARGGKSGSSFRKTTDDRFVLKDMLKSEIDSFIEFAPHYFNYIHKCCVNQMPTLLAKIVGVFFIKSRNNVTSQSFQTNVLVIENLFYSRDIIRKFDLKGSVRNRLVNIEGGGHESDLVLLDENLISMTFASPFYIRPHSKTILLQAIHNDVDFLAGQVVMDYSLLVGLDETSQELVVGIIDYIRTFTWDKKIETMVKKGIMRGQGKSPTIISPDEYKKRFIDAMHQYFPSVPDQWVGFGRGINI